MKRTIRLCTFETNSSSVHTLQILTKDDYDKWKNGGYLDEWNNEVYSKEEALELIKEDLNKEEFKEITNYSKEEFDREMEEWGLELYETYGGPYYEDYEKSFTTPSGDNMIVFGYYGVN